MASYFRFMQERYSGGISLFTFRLDEDETADIARKLIEEGNIFGSHVFGNIVKCKAKYNPLWDFHFEPASIGFFEFNIEVCDANIQHVSEKLDTVGGSFLPNSFWCPWTSQLHDEVTDRIDPEAEVWFVEDEARIFEL